MAVVKVENNRYTVEPLYQWDKNQVLEIRGLSLARVPEIHFTNAGMGGAIVRQASMDDAGIITANIPNSFLQTSAKVIVYVCMYEDETFETLYKIEIPVNARNKPNDYTLESDEEVYSFNALENQIVNALEEMDAATAQSKQALNKAIADYNAAFANIVSAKEEIINSLTPEDIDAATADHVHKNYASEVIVEGDGNAVTEIEQSGNTITATKGKSFAAEDHSHTPASLGAAAEDHTHTPAEIGAVSKTGDTMTGKLYMKTNADGKSTMTISVYNDKVPTIAYTDADGNRVNVLAMQSYGTELGAPLLISNGGTGATSKEDALVKLGAAAVGHGHTLTVKRLWAGSAGNGTAITLSDSLDNYTLIGAMVEYRHAGLMYNNFGGSTPFGFTASYVNDNKELVTYTGGFSFASTDTDHTQLTISKVARINHTGGGNHASAADANVTLIYGVSIA